MPRRAQVARDVVVLRREPARGVDDEDHDVGLGHRLARLARHLLDDAGLAVGSKPPVSMTMNSRSGPGGVAVVAVAREPAKSATIASRLFVMRLNSVDLPTLGPDDGDDGFHGARFGRAPRAEGVNGRRCGW